MLRWLSGLGGCILMVACSSAHETRAHDDGTGGVSGSTGGSVASGGAASGGAGSGGATGGGAFGGMPSGGSGAGAAAVGGSAGDVSACNELEASAPPYPMTSDPGPVPEGRGGTVLDGTYFATGETYYETTTSVTGERRGARVDVTADTWQEVDSATPGDDFVQRLTYRVTYDGATLIMTELCPSSSEPRNFQYTAEGNGFVVYVPNSSGTFGITFARQ